jgi:vacuolar-type H+-ATPase subunit H
MGLEKILQRIQDEAQTEVERIIQEAEKKADEIKEDARKDASKHGASLLKAKEHEAHLEASRIVTQARLERKIHLLRSKKELIEKVLDKAFQAESLGERGLKKEVILKDGKREELFDEEKLKQELRPLLEGYIAEILKI